MAVSTLERQRLMIEVPLSALSRTETQTMIQCIVGATMRSDLLEMILGLTEGNPFFVEETVRSAITAGGGTLATRWMRVPRTVHDGVQRRVNGLGESARRVVQIAAVAGRRFDFALLQMLLGIDERELFDASDSNSAVTPGARRYNMPISEQPEQEEALYGPNGALTRSSSWR